MWPFQRLAGESKEQAWHRLYDELLDVPEGYISLGKHGERLAEFLNVTSDSSLPVGYIVGKPVTHVQEWRTNCAMTQHAGMIWMQRSMKPYNNGESIEQYVELVRGGKNWKKNDGKAVPEGKACLFYVGPSRYFGFDHVGAFGRKIDDRHYSSYEGGGGDGTKIGHNDRFLDKPDSFGRVIEGWWEIDEFIPDFDVFEEHRAVDNGADGG